jgi:hypothetical protein
VSIVGRLAITSRCDRDAESGVVSSGKFGPVEQVDRRRIRNVVIKSPELSGRECKRRSLDVFQEDAAVGFVDLRD